MSQAREQGLRPKEYAAELGIDAGHVSKILHGKFKKVDGRAEQMCKFAKKYVMARECSSEQSQQLAEEMGRLGVKLAYKAPEAAKLVCELIGTLLEKNGGPQHHE